MMISSTPALANPVSGNLENIGIKCACTNGDQEFRASREIVEGKAAIVLVSRPVRHGLFQPFWNWLYIDAQRALAKKEIIGICAGSEDGAAVAKEFERKFEEQKTLKVSETGKIIFTRQPHFLNAVLETNKTAEQRKALADSLTHAKSLEHNPGFQRWMQSDQDCVKKFRHFFQFSDHLLTGQILPPHDSTWDADLLLEFACEWRSSIANDPDPDFHPYPTKAIIDATSELVDLVIAKFGPCVTKTVTRPAYISSETLRQEISGDTRASLATKHLYERIRSGKSIFDDTGMQLIGLLGHPEYPAASLEACVRNFEIFLISFHAGPHGSSQVNLELLEEFAGRWAHFTREFQALKKVVPIDVGNALDSILVHLMNVSIAI